MSTDWTSSPLTDGAYGNFESRPHTESAFRRAFPGDTGELIRRLQSAIDPPGLFRPAPSTDKGPAKPRDPGR